MAGDGEQPAHDSHPAIVRVRAGSKVYGTGGGAVRALDGVDVELQRGRFTAIMGPSGSGKSTLLHCAAGLDRLTSGTIELDGVDLGSLGDRELTLLRRRRFGFVFQSFNLVPTLTLVENIMLPLQLAGQGVHEPWFDEVVAMLGIADRLVHRPGQLSGGQQQRAAVARALITRPDVVFADEPTGNLDTASSEDLLALLRRAVDEHGQTMVLVSHDPFAAAHADRVLFLVDGRMVGQLDAPTPEAILTRMAELSTTPRVPPTHAPTPEAEPTPGSAPAREPTPGSAPAPEPARDISPVVDAGDAPARPPGHDREARFRSLARQLRAVRAAKRRSGAADDTSAAPPEP